MIFFIPIIFCHCFSFMQRLISCLSKNRGLRAPKLKIKIKIRNAAADPATTVPSKWFLTIDLQITWTASVSMPENRNRASNAEIFQLDQSEPRRRLPQYRSRQLLHRNPTRSKDNPCHNPWQSLWNDHMQHCFPAGNSELSLLHAVYGERGVKHCLHCRSSEAD